MVPRMMKPRLKMAMAAAEMLYSATQRGGHARPRHLSGGPVPGPQVVAGRAANRVGDGAAHSASPLHACEDCGSER